MVVGGGVDMGCDFETGSMRACNDECHKDRVKASAQGRVSVTLRGIVLGLVKEYFDEVGFGGEDLRPCSVEIGETVDLPIGLSSAEVRGDDLLTLSLVGRVVIAVGEGFIDILGMAVDAGEATVGVGNVDGCGCIDETVSKDFSCAVENVRHALGVEDTVLKVLGCDGGSARRGVEVVLVGIAEGWNDVAVVEIHYLIYVSRRGFGKHTVYAEEIGANEVCAVKPLAVDEVDGLVLCGLRLNPAANEGSEQNPKETLLAEDVVCISHCMVSRGA